MTTETESRLGRRRCREKGAAVFVCVDAVTDCRNVVGQGAGESTPARPRPTPGLWNPKPRGTFIPQGLADLRLLQRGRLEARRAASAGPHQPRLGR